MESISAPPRRTATARTKPQSRRSDTPSLQTDRMQYVADEAFSPLDGDHNTAFGRLLSAHSALQKKLAQLTFADTLTGLKNRAALLISLQRAIDKSQETHSYAAVLLVDIDDFKSHNVHLGHLAGDMLLQQSARRMREAVGPDVAVARLFADKFVIVLEDLGPTCEAASARAQHIASCISNCYAAPFDTNDSSAHLTVSMGLCLIGQQDSISTDVLIDRAELVTDNAKEAGGNCLFSFEFGALEHTA